MLFQNLSSFSCYQLVCGGVCVTESVCGQNMLPLLLYAKLLYNLVLWQQLIVHSHIVQSPPGAHTDTHGHTQTHTPTKESKVQVRGQWRVGRGSENNGWGILAAENSTPCPSSYSSWAQHYDAEQRDTESSTGGLQPRAELLLTEALIDMVRGEKGEDYETMTVPVE